MLSCTATYSIMLGFGVDLYILPHSSLIFGGDNEINYITQICRDAFLNGILNEFKHIFLQCAIDDKV